jgi:hypothetical protein
MTVGELIEELKKHAPETLVIVSAYEEDYDELEVVKKIKVRQVPSENYWSGNFTDYPEEDCNVSAILLPRP